MNKIKLVAFDLDGTLLTEKKEVSEKTMTSLEGLADKGICLMPTTGRPMSGIPKEVMNLRGVRYIISANGARVFDKEKDAFIREELIPEAVCERVLNILLKYDCIKEIYYDGVGFVEEEEQKKIKSYNMSPAIIQYFLDTRKPVKSIMGKFREEGRDLDKIQGLFNDLELREKAVRELSEIKEIKMTAALESNIEINLRSVNKGTILMDMVKMLGIEPEEVMTFGDGDNDVEMLEMAGIGIAMGNGVAVAKEAADYVTGTNEEEGVAEAIKKYFEE
ncbi:Cof subfamily protein (haloacid dehalogenase superfamily) [Aequitasia blattaphilus]|uniref:Cof-type HAD-IIB family hydrolase n=1 Tax=Aequitasia blattaphilus TaxID=2949332 RepID=A0ABT1EC63_9FIRM|nr:HAD family hydrolase [Aequitasia blattaphilus]MCP1103271.1 Cof-type HAD-IIB family hydrolase [Aequitasia blattaphilus]MCR8615911.1 Cof-type HAD-IIB family hydrolase [Aequitasia blattaphilus]